MVFQLGVSVQGDVVVPVYHMRSTIGGRLQAKVESVYIFMSNPKESVLKTMCSIKLKPQSQSQILHRHSDWMA